MCDKSTAVIQFARFLVINNMMNYTKSFVLLASLLLFTATPAKAGWEFTKWGMTVQELRRTAPVKLNAGRKCPVYGGGSKYSVEATSKWKINQMNFTACYLFLNGKLRRVNLFAKKTPDSVVENVFKEWVQKYGNPTIDNTLQRVGMVEYKWVSGDSIITFDIRRNDSIEDFKEYPYIFGWQDAEPE